MSRAYPPKNIRLKQLLSSGLNIADYIYFPIGRFDELSAFNFFKKHGNVSVRTFSHNELVEHSTPLKYEIKDFGAVEKFCRKYNTRYNLLINEAINVKDALITGKMVLAVCPYF